MDESIKIRLLKGVGNDPVMRSILARMMESTQAEFCAFHTSRERELVYVMAESRELSARVAEIREKLGNAYRMFTNGFGSSESEPVERVFYRRAGSNVAYLVSNSKIESYFLVPVAFGSKVRGVLYFGSIRKEAFGRNDIAAFRSLADEGGEKVPLIYRVGGERGILEKMLDVQPVASALVSPDGRIVAANAAFREIMRLGGDIPESVYEMGKASCFNLHGIWEEFSLLQRNVVDRDLEGMCVPERSLSVSWVRLDDLSEDVGSLVVLRETSALREQAEAREEMVALVAHELRTPLTALKNSLAIIQAGDAHEIERRGSGGPGAADRREGTPDRGENAARFLSNALRTVDRLGRLVDGLIDSSSARIDDRPLRIEPHDVKRFLEDVSILFVEPMRKKGISFAIDVDPGLRELTFDRDRMEQVIQNLLANSIKHVPWGGRVVLAAEPRDECPSQLVPAALDRYIPRLAFARLSVRDSGSGIPRDVAERINESESQSRTARSSKGLGLLIAQRLMRLHGGSLAIEEGLEKGSAVHLTLPVDRETARIAQDLRIMEMRLEAALARGLTARVFAVARYGSGPWSGTGAGRRPALIESPGREAEEENAVLLWPLGDRFALALSAGGGLDGEPGSLFEGMETGWAAAPGEGADLAGLLSIALERMEGARLSQALKGDSE